MKHNKEKQIGLRINNDDHAYLKEKNIPISKTIQELIQNDRKKTSSTNSGENEVFSGENEVLKKIKFTSPNKYDLLDIRMVKAIMEHAPSPNIGKSHLHIHQDKTIIRLLDKSLVNNIENNVKSEVKLKTPKDDDLFEAGGRVEVQQAYTFTWTNNASQPIYKFNFETCSTYRVNRTTKVKTVKKYIARITNKDVYHFLNQYIRTSMDMFQAPRMEKMLPSSYWQFLRMAGSQSA